MKISKRWFILPGLLLLLFGGLAPAQNKVVDWSKRTFRKLMQEDAPPEQPRLLIYPTIAYAPETSLEIGFSTLFLYHAKRDTLNRLSELSAFTFFTLRSQYGIWADHAFYSDKNKWMLLGRLRYQDFPLFYYGIGPREDETYDAIIGGRYLLWRERMMRQIKGNWFVGFQADLQQIARVDFAWEDSTSTFELPLGAEGSTNLGLGLNFMYDDRYNVLNVRKGWYGEVGFLRYAPTWGSNFDFNVVHWDLRTFRPFNKHQVLAAQFLGQLTQGDAPFNQLALLGGDQLMRGYYLGRFRDNNLVAAQVEYRWLPFPFAKRWGGAVFMAAGSVFPDLESAPVLRLAGGAGVRFLLFEQKDVFVRFDVGFTQEGTGAYFYIGEAF